MTLRCQAQRDDFLLLMRLKQEGSMDDKVPKENPFRKKEIINILYFFVMLLVSFAHQTKAAYYKTNIQKKNTKTETIKKVSNDVK